MAEKATQPDSGHLGASATHSRCPRYRDTSVERHHCRPGRNKEQAMQDKFSRRIEVAPNAWGPASPPQPNLTFKMT